MKNKALMESSLLTTILWAIFLIVAATGVFLLIKNLIANN